MTGLQKWRGISFVSCWLLRILFYRVPIVSRFTNFVMICHNSEGIWNWSVPPILGGPFNQVYTKVIFLVVFLSEEYLTRFSQFVGIVPDSTNGTVEKSSSNTKWYCGLTIPVFGFQTSAMLPVWNGESPKYTPIRKRGSHFGGPAPPALCKLASNAYIGQKRVWKDFTGISSKYTPFKIEDGVRPLWYTCRPLCLSETSLMTNGPNNLSKICGHILIPCRSSVHVLFVRSLFLFSAIPFWWWVPTPQNVICWSLLFIASTKPFSENLPLSAC